MNGKHEEFGYFERMNRKKILRGVSLLSNAMTKIAAEFMVWEGYEVTRPIDNKMEFSAVHVPIGRSLC